MKYIVKNAEPTAFSQWKALTNANWQPAYSTLQGAEKAAVVSSLLDEQGCICCYCEKRIGKNNSHIDHLIPQSVDAPLALNYANLLRSCQGTDEDDEHLTKEAPEHCGHSRGNNVLPVTPLQPNCESRFRYTGEGEIKAAIAGDNEAEDTVGLLKLDIDNLNAGRRDAIRGATEGLDTLSPHEKMQLELAFYSRDSQNRFMPFCSAIVYFVRNNY